MIKADPRIFRTQEALELYDELRAVVPVFSPGTPAEVVRATIDRRTQRVFEIALDLDLELTAAGRGTILKGWHGYDAI